jgi:MvaI/BcnI restriction endonuclease family
MTTLREYAREIVEKTGQSFVSGEIFAKILTDNDDSGRHGVLIPTDAYSYFPELTIPDLKQNATAQFLAIDARSGVEKTLAYKYYERYPERRITRLCGLINDRTAGWRIVVFLHAKHSDGSSAYYFDCSNVETDKRFWPLFKLIFGDAIKVSTGRFIVRPIDASEFEIDAVLAELLLKFDRIRKRGWIPTLRGGDTGIGYTFERLLGIKENNDQIADFKGIEIKCKGKKEGSTGAGGKMNLFQAAPTWLSNLSAKERIRILGKLRSNGLYACYSQVTTRMNNLGLALRVLDPQHKIDLTKRRESLGYWSYAQLEKRLQEKHARAAFINAEIRSAKSSTSYHYEEFVYCDRPNLTRFVDLVSDRRIVFEFLLSERLNGSIRNHGYPWRLIRTEFLSHLFTFQIRLR